MIERFSLERVNKAPASFDTSKLVAFQAHYMKDVPLEEKVGSALPFLERAAVIPSPPPSAILEKVTRILEAAGDRLRVAGDVLEYTEFLLPDDELAYDEKAFEKRLRRPEEAAPLLDRLKEELAAADPFDPATVESVLQGFVSSEGIRIGQVVHALRVALTGKAVGFGIFDVLAILGREHCVNRIERALARI
jgi:glutamyl-tRNA synthetase